MEWLEYLIHFVLHLDKHLYELVTTYGIWVHVLLFLIVFAETGFVATPFLPGDSLLFAAGAIAATGALHVYALIAILAVAAILGDTVNYWIGYYIGPKIFKKQKSLFFNPEYLERTYRFFEKHGGKTIVIARFIPIIRTFAPFIAGIGRMSYLRFALYNILGAVFWVPVFIYAGYFLGNIHFIKQHFSLMIIALIVVSLIPAVLEYLRHRQAKKEEIANN
ncbi:MAG: DedA family protein [Candidatus Jettenia sp.]|uniref:VTT domain-containing protein n=1 Tax=Candidatus Jettenia caeni TaxID=247490 RepID=I3IKV7_9BACT|nr:DedA family protein [Candidatus Jettenia sp. AMX1]MBC6929560.1 DedA family protein [Candidatus Jettenia sp.]WKZ14200.1 MAG: DedA family protein [Candidatus Jettenia caeni]KAA0247802.1 MAG: DedA family protein [Candidatus Jettenia sp. AMX1]MCE7881071.1 DedA family protein [Candidatus Jettenia sp. AMX1]MCQ3927795.1 DedA family protein [Candidatus Jettenia sp.]